MRSRIPSGTPFADVTIGVARPLVRKGADAAAAGVVREFRAGMGR